MGASKKLQTVAPWTSASICAISNLIALDHALRMSWANDKLEGQVPKKHFLPLARVSNQLESSLDRTHIIFFLIIGKKKKKKFLFEFF